MTNTDVVLEMVAAERERQLAKWGEQSHSNVEWITVLAEEFGEAAQEVLRSHFGDKDQGDLVDELVQVAAVAVAHLECIIFGSA
jgi:NTP pyrophosphatase (non-canonical NTP hydrolase)